MIVKANSATQSANLQEWQNSAGNYVSRIDQNGAFRSIGYATFSPSATNTVPMTVAGRASQTADIIQFQNSTPTTLSGINAAGQIYAGTTAAVVGSTTLIGITSAAYTSATVAVFTYGGTSLIAAGQTVTVAGVTGGTYNGTWVVSAATTTTFTVLGSGFTNVAGSGGTVKMSATGTFVSQTIATVPLIVQGASGQTAVLQEWQNSAGTMQANMSNGGTFSSNAVTVQNYVTGNLVNGVQLKPNNNTANTLNSGSIQITGTQSNQLPLLVKQAALTAGTITAATANGTTITYTASNTSYFVAGQTVTITGVISTGNSGGTAGSGFNLTGATIATASATQFTVTNALSDTYTSGGTATIAAQTADLTQWQNSSGTVTAKVDYLGNLSANQLKVGVNNARFLAGTSNAIAADSASSGNIAFQVRGVASQTADLQQWINSAGTTLSGVNAAGQIYAGTTAAVVGSTTTAITSAAYTSATVAVFTYGGTSLVQAGQTVTVAGVTGGTYNGTWIVSAATTTTFTVLGSGFTNVAGSGGTVKISSVTSAVATTAAVTPLVVQAAASQTANTFEVQNSSGTALAKVDSAGNLTATSYNGPVLYTVNNQTGTTFTPVLADNYSIVTLNNASAIAVTIPTNASVAYPVGSQLNFVWITGAGQPTITAVTPGTTTIISTGATATGPKLRAVNSAATAIKIATDKWLVTGDIA